MKIGIITYNTNHLKTEQILTTITRYYNHSNITLYALPFKEREKRDILFEHRPTQTSGVCTQVLAKAYKIKYIYCKNGDKDIDNTSDIYLVAGAGIISPECILGKKILNSHPGIIPLSRGLDAFKWSIYDFLPIGVTLHYIDSRVDKGEIVAIERTPLFKKDTLSSFARRHYELEIEMLSHFDYYLTSRRNEFANCKSGVAHMRMNRKLEEELEGKFVLYKRRYAL